LKTATDEQHSFFFVELKNNAERGFVKVYPDRSACSTAWLCCSLCIFLTEHYLHRNTTKRLWLLLQKCWAEDELDRPDFQAIKTALSAMRTASVRPIRLAYTPTALVAFKHRTYFWRAFPSNYYFLW